MDTLATACQKSLSGCTPFASSMGRGAWGANRSSVPGPSPMEGPFINAFRLKHLTCHIDWFLKRCLGVF